MGGIIQEDKSEETNKITNHEITIVNVSTETEVGWGHRHIQALMMFFCLVTAMSMRSSMGVALVAMCTGVNNTTVSQIINLTVTSVNETNISTNITNIKTIDELDSIPMFDWNKKTQDMIQSSFFWGYMLMQLPAGALAHRFGAKILLIAAMMINSVVSICIPWAAIHGGSWWLIVCRSMQGLSQAVVIPSLHTLLGKWAPLQERGRISAFVHGGQALGTVVGLPITGYIAASSLGWPGIFRFYGLLAALFGIVWILFGAESPAHHKNISFKEKNYIQLGLGQKEGQNMKHLPVPWKSILKSRGLWAIVIAHISTCWGQITLYSQIPSYMSQVMKVNIKTNGLLTALPFMVMWFTNFFFSWVTDLIINKEILSRTATRKLANTVGCWPAALGLVALAYAPPDNVVLVESILVFTCAFKISAHLGFMVNHIDISPNFAGTMMSISNFVSNGVSSFSPVLAGYILTDVRDPLRWRYVFFIAALIYFFTNLVYIILGTAEKAEWNDYHETETERQSLSQKKDETTF